MLLLHHFIVRHLSGSNELLQVFLSFTIYDLKQPLPAYNCIVYLLPKNTQSQCPSVSIRSLYARGSRMHRFCSEQMWFQRLMAVTTGVCLSLAGYLRRLLTTQGINASAPACGGVVDLWTRRRNSVKQKVSLMIRICEVLSHFLPRSVHHKGGCLHLRFTEVHFELCILLRVRLLVPLSVSCTTGYIKGKENKRSHKIKSYLSGQKWCPTLDIFTLYSNILFNKYLKCCLLVALVCLECKLNLRSDKNLRRVGKTFT